MPKDLDRAAEMVTSLTIDLSRALDREELLRKRCGEHVKTVEELHSTIRNLRAKLERLERLSFQQNKNSLN